jgi:hypothetical protein
LQQEGVEVQARGPVHEAFAEPALRGPRPTPVVTKQPPDPIEELPPDQKPAGDNVQWIPGYWAWDDERGDFLWVSGTWRGIPPGRQWVPGYWSQVKGGWQWAAGYWAGQNQQDVEYLPAPPDPIQEAESTPASADDVYVPGCWVYRDDRYLWRPGFWVTYRPGSLWVPANYCWTPAGYIFVDGYWDYPLGSRGLLFAPVAFERRVWAQPDWFYQPSYVVSDAFLVSSLFVRPRYDHYYFGDYFEPRYQQAGFVSWVDFRVSRQFHDPLLSYYRWQFRNNPSWVRDLRQVYVGRTQGTIPRPPRTLVQQNTLVQNRVVTNVQNTAINNITNVTNLRSVAPLASLTQLRRSNVVRLQPLSRTQLTAERRVVQQYRTLGSERARVQATVINRGSPGRTATPTAAVRVPLPGLRTATRAPATAKAPPPAPNVPQPSLHTRAETGRTGQLGRPEARPAERPVRPGEERPRAEPRPGERPVRPTTPPARVEPRPGERPAAPPADVRRENRPSESRTPRQPPEPPPTPPRTPEPNRPPAAPPARPPETRTPRDAPAPPRTPREAPPPRTPEPNRPPEARAPREAPAPPRAPETRAPREAPPPRPPQTQRPPAPPRTPEPNRPPAPPRTPEPNRPGQERPPDK